MRRLRVKRGRTRRESDGPRRDSHRVVRRSSCRAGRCSCSALRSRRRGCRTRCSTSTSCRGCHRARSSRSDSSSRRRSGRPRWRDTRRGFPASCKDRPPVPPARERDRARRRLAIPNPRAMPRPIPNPRAMPYPIPSPTETPCPHARRRHPSPHPNHDRLDADPRHRRSTRGRERECNRAASHSRSRSHS